MLSLRIHMLRRYTQTVTDMLSELQKTEESLKKFKKGKKGGPMGSSLLVGTTSNERSMSDEDKIRLQVLLDVQGFGQQLKNCGVPADTFVPYRNLRDTVQKYENLLT
ncbi:hypothetical protein INT43_000974 [Umbelopsis isabellina]|uniref:COG complex component COG2 C-terminal domain-containing protein n=1 Tax=Mortierella isabellina TaxID=91625 RepID=A0A8H7UGM3_MORIS|nr:hypothetical protein INT43_000974 [Umbelopsis isabellina]